MLFQRRRKRPRLLESWGQEDPCARALHRNASATGSRSGSGRGQAQRGGDDVMGTWMVLEQFQSLVGNQIFVANNSHKAEITLCHFCIYALYIPCTCLFFLVIVWFVWCPFCCYDMVLVAFHPLIVESFLLLQSPLKRLLIWPCNDWEGAIRSNGHMGSQGASKSFPLLPRMNRCFCCSKSTLFLLLKCFAR